MRTLMLTLALALAMAVAACAAPDKDVFRGTHAYCYFNDKTLTWRLGNEVVERTIHFDRETGALRTLGVKFKGRGPRITPVGSVEGEFILAGPAGETDKPTAIRLDGDWVYQWQIVTRPAHGGRLLTIHLWGKGRNQGYEVEALFEVLPGNRPYLGKQLALINRTGAPRTVSQVTYDRWALTPPAIRRKKGESLATGPAVYKVEGETATVTDPASGAAMVASVLGAGGETLWQNGAVTLRSTTPMDMRGDGGRALPPPAAVAVFSGDVVPLWQQVVPR